MGANGVLFGGKDTILPAELRATGQVIYSLR